MTKMALIVFLALHGLVHLLYLGHARGAFALEDGLSWPEGSWLMSRLVGTHAVNSVAAVCCLVAAGGFLLGAVGGLLGQTWWPYVVLGAVGLSSLLYVTTWDGSAANLDGKGGVALLVNAGIVAGLLLTGVVQRGVE